MDGHAPGGYYPYWDEEDFFNSQPTQEVTLRGGVKKRMCNNCESYSVKMSAKGNWYCADLCWVEPAPDNHIDKR